MPLDVRDARIRNALYLPGRVTFRGQHYLDARRRHLLAAAPFDEGAFPTANYSSRHQEDPPARRLVAAPATPRGDRPLGIFISARYLPNAEAAFYFSGVTYTTVGYGDFVLAKPCRLLAPVEGLVGVLMCGLSMGYFFVVVNRILQGQPQGSPTASGRD